MKYYTVYAQHHQKVYKEFDNLNEAIELLEYGSDHGLIFQLFICSRDDYDNVELIKEQENYQPMVNEKSDVFENFRNQILVGTCKDELDRFIKT